MLLSQADACICYSEEGSQRLAKVVAPDRLFVARNTFDLSEPLELAARIGRQAPPGFPHILSVGRAVPAKNFPLLIRAFQQFRLSASDAVLTIIGDGPDMEKMHATAAGDPQIRLLGEVYGEELLAKEFMAADLFVYAGSIGLGANHALAYGLPVMIFERTPDGPYHAPEESVRATWSNRRSGQSLLRRCARGCAE